ncbi:hypothetical protein PV328_005722 [Microctonus aethiopoides]|uniref:AAA-ATPase-like domain-containing protein n=1 Tax=Microctonus aethiopoides TaxID=144406 RepID=A0AA39KSL2_9HYME|nr:hypothetical protein PV328_005722 [Microctonus aethiopoides]
MEPPVLRRLKVMKGHNMKKPIKKPSNATATREINTHYSYYDWHYNQPFYVDKTLLIKKLLKVNHVMISAPSGFGKTLNMDMVRRFLEIEVDEDGKAIKLDVDEDKGCLKSVQTKSKNFKLFEGKKILEDKKFVFKHFGKYPTVHVDFSELVGNDYEEILVKFRKILNKAFRQHAYLEKCSLWDTEIHNKDTFMEYFDPVKCASLDECDVRDGLDLLSRFLHDHHGKAVYMFIDEVDAPANALVYQNIMTTKDSKKTISLLQRITKGLLKGNEFIERSLTHACQQTGSFILQDANNVRRCYFMKHHTLRKFYGFEEAEVKDLLEKAGRLEDFNKIKEQFNGYNTISVDGIDTNMYSTWAIMNYLKTGNFNLHWSGGILHKLKELIGHDKIRPKIAQIMSNEMNKIEYSVMLSMCHIESLSKILCNGEVNEDCDFFFQFLMEQGFFRPTNPGGFTVNLVIPNRSAYSVFDEIMRSIDSINKYYNHFPDLIENFTESLEDLARSRNKDAVYALAENIDVLFRSGKTFETKYELQSILDAYMIQKFRHVFPQCKTSLHTKCDTVLVIADVMFIIEYEGWRFSNSSYGQILDEAYNTLVEESSLKEIFPKNTPTVKNRIYLKIHLDKLGKISIKYSFNNMESKTVASKGAQN